MPRRRLQKKAIRGQRQVFPIGSLSEHSTITTDLDLDADLVVDLEKVVNSQDNAGFEEVQVQV